MALGEVCENIFAGGDLPKNYIKSTKPKENFIYPIYSNGTDDKALYGFSNTYKIDKEAVTISARGTIGFSQVRDKYFTPIVRLIVLIPKDNMLTPKFLNYTLQTITIKGSNTSGIPQLTVPNVKKIQIPLPPLEIQEKIVSILDKFESLANDLSEGLPAEIKARKKQYEYYREKLLSF